MASISTTIKKASSSSAKHSALSIRRRTALADALAGVIATLISLWTFYPIDVLKTKLQAGTENDDDNSNHKNNSLWTGLFRGLQLKTLHAASSSFCYFYLYSFIASWWTSHYNNNGSNKVSPAVRLSLSAVAAMMNTFLTLPLDVLASQKQAATTNADYGKNENSTRIMEAAFATAAATDETQDESSSSLEEEEQQRKEEAVLHQQKMDFVWNQLQIEKSLASAPSQGNNNNNNNSEEQQTLENIWNQLQKEKAQPSTPHINDTPEEHEHDGDVFYDAWSEKCPPEANRVANDIHDSEEETKSDNDNESYAPSPTHGQVTVTFTAASSQNNKTIATTNNELKKVLQLETQSTSGSSWSTSDDSDSEPSHPSPPSSRLGKQLEAYISQYTSLWKGLHPSLLLCSNPSIHYTVFDMAKSSLLQSRSLSSSGSSKASNNLSMMDAFLLGLFAKFCATMATYPLIRAKVMLMVTSRKSMMHTLASIYQQDGIAKGWYKGCSVQLLHTLLKSALLMMVKEGISHTTHRLLVPSSSAQQQQQH